MEESGDKEAAAHTDPVSVAPSKNNTQEYQQKASLEHILRRADVYIGSVQRTEPTLMWVYSRAEVRLVQRDITFVPGLYKIFDEIIINAADNNQRDATMTMLKVDIDQDQSEISVWNNGRGIPVVMHKIEKVYVPEMMFGMLHTDSDYDDDEKKVVGGRNGYGAKLCNIFSSKFTVETSAKETSNSYSQTWRNNFKKEDPKVSDAKEEDYTKVTFQPDLTRFGMETLDDDIVELMMRRAYDVAGSLKGVGVMLNGHRLPVDGFKQCVQQYVQDRTDEHNEPLNIVYEQSNDRWEYALTVSSTGFQNVSFVNSIATNEGGTHVNYVADMIVAKMIEHIKNKLGKSDMTIEPSQVKNRMWIFVNCLIENPWFNSQTKDTLTTTSTNFGGTCAVSDMFVTQALKCGVIESIEAFQ